MGLFQSDKIILLKSEIINTGFVTPQESHRGDAETVQQQLTGDLYMGLLQRDKRFF